MAVNLLHKLPKTYTINGIQYYTRTNEKVNDVKNLTKSNNHQINNMSDSKELDDVNRINEVNISNKKLIIEFEEWHYQCSDKCCDSYGTYLYLNGKKLEHPNTDIQDNGYLGEDLQTGLHAVLKKLGYEVEFKNR
jgi:hypothetical protein